MKTKVLHLEIDCCADCPYCRYDPYYDCSSDAGFDCEHNDGSRIVNEGGYKEIESGYARKVVNSGIPEWCPLEDKEKSNERI